MSQIPHIINIADFSKKQLEDLSILASRIQENSQLYADYLKGKILATLFFEPSTRTRLSFESAMLRLGGKIMSVENASSSSVSKGERLEDMGRMLSCYADVVVLRHSEEDSINRFSKVSDIPVINAGNGSHEHPTQALLDYHTICAKKGRLDHLHIGFVGDLKHGRTVHSLVTLLRHFPVTFYFIANSELQIPQSVLDAFSHHPESKFHFCSDLSIIDDLDVLYVTRLQVERLKDHEKAYLISQQFCITPKVIKNAKSNLIILHPLPRVSELDIAVDEDERACYFLQAKYGVYVRMALLISLLNF